MKKIFLIGLISIVSLSSCKKFNCNCTVIRTDLNGFITNTESVTHIVKAPSKVKAEEKCKEHNAVKTNFSKSCSIYK